MSLPAAQLTVLGLGPFGVCGDEGMRDFDARKMMTLTKRSLVAKSPKQRYPTDMKDNSLRRVLVKGREGPRNLISEMQRMLSNLGFKGNGLEF